MSHTRLARRRPSAAGTFSPSTTAPPAFPFSRVFQELNEHADELMRNVFAGVPEFPAVERFPALNLSEDKEEFTVSAELPGMTADDVTIDYCDGVLSIRGEKEHEETKDEDDRKYYLWERRFGSFQRSLPFPGGIADDRITADFKDGVLTVHLPKADEAKAKRREIAVTPK